MKYLFTFMLLMLVLSSCKSGEFYQADYDSEIIVIRDVYGVIETAREVGIDSVSLMRVIISPNKKTSFVPFSGSSDQKYIQSKTHIEEHIRIPVNSLIKRQ